MTTAVPVIGTAVLSFVEISIRLSCQHEDHISLIADNSCENRANQITNQENNYSYRRISCFLCEIKLDLREHPGRRLGPRRARRPVRSVVGGDRIFAEGVPGGIKVEAILMCINTLQYLRAGQRVARRFCKCF